MMKQFLAVLLCVIFFLPLTGSIYDQPVYDRADWTSVDDYGIIWHHVDSTESIPIQQDPAWAGVETAWWEISSYDVNRNAIHDSIESSTGLVGMGVSYDVEVSEVQLQELASLGIVVVDTLESINSVLIGLQETNLAESISNLSNVVMVHQYGAVKFYGDIQTPNVKARNSSIYPDAAWNFGVTGKGVNIAMVDTGVDNEHPGLVDKFVAGYDAVCYLHTDPT